MSDRKVRKDDVLISILNHEVKTSTEYDFTKVQQLPDYTYLYGRFYTILSEKPLKENNRLGKAIVQTCKECRNIWITMNVYPMHYTSIHRKFSKTLRDFHSLVTRGESQKQKTWWKKKAQTICNDMQKGVDIITNDADAQKILETE